MGYALQVDGMEEISTMLEKMEQQAPTAAAKALYEGAGVMAEELKKSAATIKTATFKYAREGETRLPSPQEKAVILSAHGIGIARFRKDGVEVDTSVGYAGSGYAEMAGKEVPIPRVANAINSGTSFMQKQPFVRQAIRSGGNKAMKAMKDSIEKDFDALTK